MTGISRMPEICVPMVYEDNIMLRTYIWKHGNQTSVEAGRYKDRYSSNVAEKGTHPDTGTGPRSLPEIHTYTYVGVELLHGLHCTVQ